MKSWFSTKKRIAAVGLSGALVLGIAGIALAGFNGSVTGQVPVAGSSAWTVTLGTISCPNGSLNPVKNPPACTVPYTVTNGSGGPLTLNSLSAIVNTALPVVSPQTIVTQNNGLQVAGCYEAAAAPLSATGDNPNQAPGTQTAGPSPAGGAKSSWFTITNTLPNSVSPALIFGSSYPTGTTFSGGFATVVMPPLSVNENACSGTMPDIIINAS